MTRMIPTGRAIPRVKPGSADWLQLMTGSKIAAVLGLSPWESPFSLWHRMAGSVEPEAQTDEQARGHYLEGPVCDWWADQHPEYKIRRAPTYVHRHRPWQGASPDRIATATSLHDELLRILMLEAKTDASGDGWGDAGTDDIPIYYKAQAIWTLDVLGLPEARVPVLLPRLEFREYVVKHDIAEAEYMRARALTFMASIRAGEAPPIDESDATYRMVKALHPDIDDVEIQLPGDLAERYRGTYAARKAAEKAHALTQTEVADAMGTARYAVDHDGEKVAIRQPGRGNNPPFVKYAGQKPATQKRIAA